MSIALAGDHYELQPVLACVTDQESSLFAGQLNLACYESVRLVWFPGCCHLDSNTDKGAMEASGFGHLAEKVNFLAKLNHGPFKGGRWLGVQKMAAKAFVDAVRNNDSVAVDLFEAAVASISAEMGWAGPETAQARTLARLRLTSVCVL